MTTPGCGNFPAKSVPCSALRVDDHAPRASVQSGQSQWTDVPGLGYCLPLARIPFCRVGEGSPTMPASPANASSPPHAGDARGTQPTGTSLLGRLAPVMVSVAVLGVSILVFLGQRSMAQRAAIAGEQAYADQVSYWIMPAVDKHHVETLYVQNRGMTPVSMVILGLPAISPAAGTAVPSRAGFGSIPSCMTLEASLPGMTTKIAGSYLQFTDSTGRTWVRTSRGKLNTLSSAHYGTPPAEVPLNQRHFLPMEGCS